MPDKQPLILCIDDDPDILSFLQIVLEAADYRYVGAGTAEAGLRAYAEEAPDLIIVDLMMEEIDSGKNFAGEMRKQGNTAPVFMLSSVGDNLSGVLDYTELGLAGVFQKPLDKRHLLAVMKAKLG
ncbi:MAG: response regulator [bacterium]|nr:response regulator [bacterium]